MTSFASWVDTDLASVADTDARALLAALRGLPAGEWAAGADAGRVEALALVNRVDGELRRRIAAAGGAAPAWAAGLRPALEARALIHGHTNGLKMAALREAGAAFAARGIEAVALKGIPLAYGVYAEPGDRPFNDVDLLVAPGELVAAEEVLESLGYARGKAQAGEGGQEKSFLRGLGQGVVLDVDLHWSLVGALSLLREMRPDEDGMRARSVVAFPGVRFPAAEDALVLAAVNLVKHGFRPLGNILDFRELLRGADPVRLAALAERTRTATGLSAGLALAAALFGAEVPAPLDRPLPRWQRTLFRRLLRPGLLVQPELADGATARYAMKILSQDGARGVGRTLMGMPGVVVRRVAGR